MKCPQLALFRPIFFLFSTLHAKKLRDIFFHFFSFPGPEIVTQNHVDNCQFLAKNKTSQS